ncbi:MAG: DMT family protein [Planctomycetaceae bacterium]|nr:DMT family protein [Planctomycetaceae bacterium]
MFTALLLTISNIFMTFAWYGHLRYKSAPLWIAIGVSWLIAFIEYCFQVPANRIGHQQFTAPQLKIMQEVITLIVFGAFSVLYLGETPRWNEVLGFVLIAAAVLVVFVLNPRRGVVVDQIGSDPVSAAVTPDSQIP